MKLAEGNTRLERGGLGLDAKDLSFDVGDAGDRARLALLVPWAALRVLDNGVKTPDGEVARSGDVPLGDRARTRVSEPTAPTAPR